MDDKIADGLAEIVSQLERADAMLENGEEGDGDPLREAVRGALGTAREILEEARQSVETPPSSPLEERTLFEALEALLADYAEREEWRGDLSVDGDLDQFAEPFASGLYLVVQKSLATIATFTEAEAVEVSVIVEPEVVEVIISDCGTGFDPAAPQADSGFAEIREQAREIGGEFRLESSWTEGTAIVVDVEKSVIGD